MLNEFIPRLYHGGQNIDPQNVVTGSGNDPTALIILGVIVVLVIGAIVYLRKRYKKKYSY